MSQGSKQRSQLLKQLKCLLVQHTEYDDTVNHYFMLVISCESFKTIDFNFVRKNYTSQVISELQSVLYSNAD